MDEETEDLSGTQPLRSVVVQDAELPDNSQGGPSTELLKSKASCPPFGSAVSALQSKVKAVSKKKFKGTERDDLLPECSTEESLKKKQDGEVLSPCQVSTEYSEQSIKPSAGDEKVLEPSAMLGEKETCSKSGKENQFQGAPENHRGLCEGSSLENISVGGAGEPQRDISSKSMTSSPRHWAPPKGFWRVARPETLLLNSESSSIPPTPKDVPATAEEGPKRKPKLKSVGAVVHKELQRSDSLESAFHRCLQKEIRTADPVSGLWKADSWETVCSRGGSLSIAENIEMNKTYNQFQIETIEITTAMRPEGQYQPPKEPHRDLPPYKLDDWDSAIITKEPVFSYRPLINTSDVILSPRHEQAKRLLERARIKAHFQNSKGDTSSNIGQKEGLECLPISVSSTLHNAVLVTAQEEVTSALEQTDVRGRNHERGVRFRRYGQSPTRVRFEDESEKEAERRYLERVRERGPVVVEKSHSTQQQKAEPMYKIPEDSRGAAINWVNVGIPVAILTKEGECVAAMVPKEDILRTCTACGSILGPAQTKDCPSNLTHNFSDSREKEVPRWVTPIQPCRQTTHPTAEKIKLTGSVSLAESVGRGGVGGAGESMSAFGKLRRRSRKGESRVETGNGPYAQCQDLWAQRRNSKTRSSLEPFTKVVKTFDQGASESSPNLENKDLSSNVKEPHTQLPIKSALKSGSKNRPTGQRVVKLMPSVQYRLIHLDDNLDGSSHHSIQPEEHLSVTLSASPQVLPVTTGLTSCNRPSSLRYSSSMLTSELQALTIWDSSGDPVTGHLASEVLCRDPRSICTAPASADIHPALRVMGMSKGEDLRAELLRAEHRKTELHWDDSLAVSRREGRPKLSLRRFFSAMGLNSMGKLVKGNRSNSMEHLCFPAARYSSASSSPTHRGLAPLKRTPSLQSLHMESPLAQLRKASSVQSLQSPKRKFDRSTILGELPLPLSLAPRELQNQEGIEEAVEDSRGPIGRLVQAFPDGTVLIELIRPANNRPFGFVISRGKGRPDAGIYVERVGDTAADNIYTGLLGVGDEILEVNGEIIAGLSLDQVTRLMTRDSKATMRIHPHSWIKH